MGILDEAIREHLELKRQHGADEPELKKLEDEALGAAGRRGEIEEPPEMSDAEAEAPTDYIGSPAAAPPEQESRRAPRSSASEAPEPRADAPAPGPADLRPPEMRPEEPPPSSAEAEEEPAPDAEEARRGRGRRRPRRSIRRWSTRFPNPRPEEAAPETSAEPPEPPPVEAGGVSAELRAEREEIAQHPTEHYDVEGEIAEAEKEAAGFFNEQSLSDELDQALDSPETAPPTEEPVPADATDEVEVEVIAEAEEPERGRGGRAGGRRGGRARGGRGDRRRGGRGG